MYVEAAGKNSAVSFSQVWQYTSTIHKASSHISTCGWVRMISHKI